MNHALNLGNMAVRSKTAVCRLKIKTNVLVFVLAVFVAVAVMQTVQLGNMLSEAKSVNEDVRDIRAKQKILYEQYSFYGNNLSHYFNDYSH